MRDRSITVKQISLLKTLISEVEPEMVIPEKCNRYMADARIKWLLKKKANPAITKKQYMN